VGPREPNHHVPSVRRRGGPPIGDAHRVQTRWGRSQPLHLAFAALTAAGLAGIDEELEPPAACEGDAYEDKSLPETAGNLRDAVEALDGSEMLRKAFGEKVVDHYVYMGRWEQSEQVSDWELKRGTIGPEHEYSSDFRQEEAST
jgi:glutamine synthetase